jgi:hypothetical protein
MQRRLRLGYTPRRAHHGRTGILNLDGTGARHRRPGSKGA